MERDSEPSRTISSAPIVSQAFGRLSDSLGPDTAQQVCLRAEQHQRELKAQRPQGWSLGMRYVLRNMEWSLALYRAALEHGLSREQAGELVEEINWSLSEPTVKTLFRLSRLRSAQLRIRLRWTYNVLFELLFTAPFERRVVASKDGVAFDAVACPFASYYRDMGAPELTRYAACSFDARVAREFGVALYKTESIADGAALCDIRFISRSVVGDEHERGGPDCRA